jgi:formylglycine-generating enzyme required for sulfatase activity
MGKNDNKASDEYPATYIYIKQFYIGKYEVTNAQYKAFVDNNPMWKKSNTSALVSKKLVDVDYLNDWDNNSYKEKFKNHPVNYVSWHAALAYTKWLSLKTGKKFRLPTEAEWEYVAGNADKNTPFAVFPISKDKLTCAENPGPDRLIPTREVGSHDASPLGIHDLNGNVSELTMSLYRRYPYSKNYETALVTYNEERISVRGGSFDSYIPDTSTKFRDFKKVYRCLPFMGFRVALDAN